MCISEQTLEFPFDVPIDWYDAVVVGGGGDDADRRRTRCHCHSSSPLLQAGEGEEVAAAGDHRRRCCCCNVSTGWTSRTHSKTRDRASGTSLGSWVFRPCCCCDAAVVVVMLRCCCCGEDSGILVMTVQAGVGVEEVDSMDAVVAVLVVADAALVGVADAVLVVDEDSGSSVGLEPEVNMTS